MSVENPNQSSFRGGRLDALVGAVTLGHFGVETTVKNGLLNEVTGETFQEPPIAQVLKTGQPVIVNDLSKKRHVSIKIVRNPKP